MAAYCDIEEMKMTPNPVYSETQTKRQIDKPISKKTSELFFQSTAKTVILYVLTTIRLIGMVTCCHPPKLHIGSLS